MNDEIRLTIPARPHMLLVARMALSGYICQCGADMDSVEDIRTLSDEACFCLMKQATPAETLTITAARDGAVAHIRFEALCGCGPCREEPPHDVEIARGILSTLASDVEIFHEKGTVCAIALAMHVGPL